MKVDTESPYHHTYPNELAAKVIVHNDNHFILPRDNHFMFNMLEIDDDTLKEENHGVKYPNENESCKVMIPPQPHGIANMENYTNSNKDEYDCMGAPYTGPNSEIGLVVKEDFYSNKAVTKAQLSEKIVSTNDGSCHKVENILIAEEVHSYQNSLAEEEMGQKVPFRCNESLNNDDSDMEKEMKGTESSHDFEYEVIDRDSVASIDRNPANPTPDNKSAEKCSCVNSIKGVDKTVTTAERVASNVSEDGDKLDINDSVISNISDVVIEKQLPSSQDLTNELLREDFSILSCSSNQKHSIDRPKVDQGILEENKFRSTMVSSAVEGSDSSNGGKEILSACKVPSGVITFTFDPQEASTSSREENRDNKDIQQSKQAHIGPGAEGATFDGATTSGRTSFLHLMQGDSNFHGPGFLSGTIANSGHIPYSGSISLRSDSSTTSARSFAFPILQSEWNSSPVKMAKARRRGPKLGLFCCRF